MGPPDRTYRVVIRLFALIFRLLGVHFDVRGVDNLPSRGGGVIAVNHTGFLDFAFLGYAARERGRLVRFLSKKSIFSSHLAGPLMRRMGHIPVDRRSGALAYRRARQSAGAGELVGFFPEATISRSWLLKAFKPGAAGVAVSRGVPLIPAIVWGGHRILTVDGHRSVRRGCRVMIRIGEPLLPAPNESIEALSGRLHATMERMLDATIDDYPERQPGAWWLPAVHGGGAPDRATAKRLDMEALERIGELDPAERMEHTGTMKSDTTEPEPEGGDPACWLHRVCQNCGALAEDEQPSVCARCGSTEFGD